MKKKIIYPALLIFSLSLLSVSCQKSQGNNMVLLPIQEDPTVSFRLWFKAGAQNDPQGKEGLAAFTAAMITEGATQKESYQDLLAKLYPMAASINNQVDKEQTIIYGRTHKDNLTDYYALLKEVVLTPAFEEKDFTRLKSNFLNYLEKNLRYTSDEELGKAVLSNFIFEGTPYGHIAAGTVSGLNAITLQDVKDFYQKYYTRDNLIIGIGGGYGSSFPEQVGNDMKALPAGAPEQVAKPEAEPINGLQVKIIEKAGANATAISFGYPIDLTRGDEDFYALALANSWLGEHRNSASHLYQVIREKRGLNYGDYSYIENFPNGGRRQFPPPNVARRQQIFQIWIRPVPNYARLFAFRAATRELQKIVDNGMSEQQFELTRTFLKNYILNYATTTSMRLGYKMDDVFYGINGHYLDLFRKKMDELTLEDVNAAIKKYWQYKNMKVVFVTDEARKLKDMLVNNTPSPIDYSTPKPENVLEEDKLIASYPLDVQPEDVIIEPVEKTFE